MRPIDADVLIETVEDHVTSVSCCPTADWARGKTQMKDQILEDIHNAPTVSDWISVKDRLPEPPAQCLVYSPKMSRPRGMETATYTELGWLTAAYFSGITHWMPLPEPPEEENENE